MKKIKYSKKNTIIIIVSLIMAFISVKLIVASAASMGKEDEVAYVMATKDIGIGDELNKENLREATTTEKELNYVKSFEEIKGMVATEQIYKDEPIIPKKIGKKDSVNQVKKKLYSIKLLPEEAVAGTIKAGDKVKVIGTLASTTGQESITDYILKEANGQAKSIDVKEVFDGNGAKITDSNVPAGMYVVEVTEDESILLDKAVATKKIKLVKDVK